MEILQTKEYKGHQINVFYDDDPESPRLWDNLGTIVCSHSRYRLGDIQVDGFQGWIEHLISKFDIDANIWDSYERANQEKILKWAQKNLLSLPLFLYDHSGISMSTASFVGRAQHADWDSGQVGFIYVSKKQVRSQYPWERITEERRCIILDVLRAEVEMYDKYLKGEIYGYNVTLNGQSIDSCWGIYEKEYCLELAQEVIDLSYKDLVEQHTRRVKNWITHRVPLSYRSPFDVKHIQI